MPNYKKSKFFVRLLPTVDMDWNNIKIDENKEVLYVRCTQDLYKNNQENKPRYWTFLTDGVFYNACQETVYSTVMEGVIEKIYEGVNSVILAFGQTCSGKSFTVGGLHVKYEFRGIIPRFIADIFTDIKSKTKEWKVKVRLSYVEMLGNVIHDLLASGNVPCDIKKISTVNIPSEEAALKLLFKGEGKRRLTCNAPYINAHCTNGIVTFHFECVSSIRSNAVINKAKVHFIDLAGLETVGKRGLTSFKSAIDQGAANLVKCDLEKAILHMTNADEYNETHKYRPRCKLIEYLGTSFSVGSLIRCIGHIRPTFTDIQVTVSILKFGQNIKHIPNVPVTRCTESNSELMFQNVMEELNQLKEQLLVDKLLGNTQEIESGNFSQTRLAHLERLASAYLQDWSSEVNVLGNTDTIITLKMFKDLFKRKNVEFETTIKELQLRVQQSDSEVRFSKSSRKSRKSKDEIVFDQTKSTVKSGRINLRESKRNKFGSKTFVSLKTSFDSPSLQVQNKEFVVEAQENKWSTQNLQNIMVPTDSDKKMWTDFLNDERIDCVVVDVLTESAKKKKIAYQTAFEDYNQTRLELDRSRVALKEIAWKRQTAKQELYDRNGRLLITQDEMAAAKFVTDLEVVEREKKKLQDEIYQEWKEATREFLEEKLKIEERFNEYCRQKFDIRVAVPAEIDSGDQSEEEITRLKKMQEEQNVQILYNCLYRKLIEKTIKRRCNNNQ